MTAIMPGRIGLSVLAYGLAATLPGAASATPERFVALEARLSNALAAYDAPAIDLLWDDKFVFVFPNGKLSRKLDRMKAQIPPPDTGGPKLVARNDAVEVEWEDAHLAIVIVKSSWQFGNAEPTRFLATHVWIKRSSGWRLISAQVAEVTP
jgi:hypothetical protein